MAMLDDLLCISECGYQTAMVNSYLKFKTCSKKLQFGAQNCKKIHIGKTKEEHKCQPLFVDNWTESEIEDGDSEMVKMEDTCNVEDEMEEKEDERYLGDVISKDGRNIQKY